MRVRKWLLFMLVMSLGWSGLGMLGHAADEARPARPPQKHEPSPHSWWSLGFTTQPASANYLGGEHGHVEVRAQGALYNSYKYVWWLSVAGEPFQKVQDGGKKFSFVVPKLKGTEPVKYYLQVAYEPTSHNIRPTTYWSRVATYTVNPRRIPAEGLSVSTTRDYLINGDALQIHPQLSPADSTDLVTWESSDPRLAPVDEAGWVTTRPVAKPVVGKHQGKVTITATANGHSQSLDLMIGALHDLNVVEGSPATFKLPPLLDDVPVNKWYRINPDGRTEELASTEHSYTVAVPTNAEDDQAAYYAELQTEDGENLRLTNAARLNVASGGELALTAVPSFHFGQVQLAQLVRPETVSLTHQPSPDSANPTADTSVTVSDQRTVGGDWTLGVQMSAFTTSPTAERPATIAARLKLRDAAGKVIHEVQTETTNQVIYSGRRGQDGHLDLTGSTLEVVTDPLITPGSYQSTLTWTLAQVPTA